MQKLYLLNYSSIFSIRLFKKYCSYLSMRSRTVQFSILDRNITILDELSTSAFINHFYLHISNGFMNSIVLLTTSYMRSIPQPGKYRYLSISIWTVNNRSWKTTNNFHTTIICDSDYFNTGEQWRNRLAKYDNYDGVRLVMLCLSNFKILLSSVQFRFNLKWKFFLADESNIFGIEISWTNHYFCQLSNFSSFRIVELKFISLHIKLVYSGSNV